MAAASKFLFHISVFLAVSMELRSCTAYLAKSGVGIAKAGRQQFCDKAEPDQEFLHANLTQSFCTFFAPHGKY
jgi:hypothetical protein